MSNKTDMTLIDAKESIAHARKLYKKSNVHISELNKQQRKDLGVTIFKILHKCMPILHLTLAFSCSAFIEIIETTIDDTKFDGEKSAQAFIELEKYLKLLYDHPWKKEFRVLKLYSGFFNTKIKAHLTNPEEIFVLVGYKRVNESDMTLQDVKPNRDHIIDVCFECLIGAVACKMVEMKHNEIKDRGGELKDAFQWMKTGVKPREEYLEKKLQARKKTQEIENVADPVLHSNQDKTPSSMYYNNDKLVVDLNFPHYDNDDSVTAGHIPYIDEGQTDNGVDISMKGTHDDHIDASLREVNLKHQRQKHLPKSDMKDFLYSKEKSDYEITSQNLSYHEVDLKSSRKISGYSKKLKDDDRYMTKTMPIMKGKKESIEIFYPPPTISPYNNITEHKRSHHLAHPYTTTYSNDVADGRQFKQMYEKPSALEMDGNLSFTSGFYDIERDDQELVLNRSYNSSPFSDEVWSCSYCTSLNNISKIVCKECNKSRHTGPDLENPKAGESKKVCSACTLENLPTAMNCSVCNTPLKPSNVQTYV